MKEQKNYYNIYIKPLVDLITKESSLEFLRTHISFVETYICEPRITNDYLIKSNDGSFKGTNSIHRKDGSFYLNSDGLYMLYRSIQQMVEVTIQGITSADEAQIKLNSPRLDKGYLPQYIKHLVDNIHKPTRKSEVIEALQLLLHKETQSQKALIMSLQIQVIQQFRRKRLYTETSKFYLNYTALSYELGISLLECLLLQHSCLKGFIYFFTKRKETITFSEEAIANFTNFVEALLVNDKVLIQEFCEEFPININLDNKIILALIRDYVLELVFTNDSNNNIPFLALKNLLEKHKSNDKYHYANELTKNLVKIVSVIITEGQEKYSNDLPALFCEDIIWESQTKTRKIVCIESSVINQIIQAHSLNKPYLTDDGEESLHQRDKEGIMKMIFENKAKFVHTNKNTKLDVPPNSYLQKDKPMNKFAVDCQALYNWLNVYVSMQSTNSDKDKEIFIEATYDVDLNRISEEDFSNWKSLLIAYGLDVMPNTAKDVLVEELITKETNNFIKKYIVECFNKIKTKKQVITALLYDSILYMCFDYYVVTFFVDSRGRVYYNLDSLNTQIHTMVKCFNKPYNFGVIIARNYDTIRKIIADQLSNPKIKEDILSVTFPQYKQLDKELEISYLKDFCKKETDIASEDKEEYSLLWQKFNDNSKCNFDTIRSLNKFIKKKKRLLYVHSAIMHLYSSTPQPNIGSYYELDATASGLQMIALLLRSSGIGMKCNLVGDTNVDIYNQFVEEFSDNVSKCLKFMLLAANTLGLDLYKFFSSYLNNLGRQLPYNIIDTFKEGTFDGQEKISRIFDSFCSLNGKVTLCEDDFINYIYTTFESEIKLLTKDSKVLESFTWLLSNEDKQHLGNGAFAMTTDCQKFILIFRRLLLFLKLLIDIDINLDNGFGSFRSLFKLAIMTYLYNATAYGRKTTFVEVLQELVKNKTVPYATYYNLATFLEQYFSTYIKKSIEDSNALFNISSLLTSLKKPIVVDNGIFIMTYNPKQEKVVVLETPTFRKKRGIQLNIRQTIDKFNSIDFNNGFIPNFVHSLDAYIAHRFIEKNIKINQELKAFTDFRLHYTLNHDTFGNNVRPFLKWIVEDCYLDLYKANPINWILNNLDEVDKTKVMSLIKNTPMTLDRLNPYFLK